MICRKQHLTLNDPDVFYARESFFLEQPADIGTNETSSLATFFLFLILLDAIAGRGLEGWREQRAPPRELPPHLSGKRYMASLLIFPRTDPIFGYIL